MAEITQQLPAVEPPSGIKYSEGIGTNKQWSTLFGGAAEIAGSAVKAADGIIQQNIYDDAEAQINPVRDLWGAEAATPGSAKGPLPPDIKRGQDYITRLTKGRQNGSLKDSHYYGQLNAVVKGLKSKYPGYGPEIDNAVSSITGVTPANAIIGALRREAEEEANASNASAVRWQSFEDQNAGLIQLWKSDYFDTPPEMRPNEDEVRQGVAQLKAQQEYVQYDNARLSNLKARGELTKEETLRSARKRVEDLTLSAMQGGMRTEAMGGGDWNVLREKIAKAQDSGKALSPDEQAQLATAASELQLKVKEQAQRTLLEMPGSELLSASERDDVIKIATMQVDSMVDAITNEKYGLIGANAAWLKATEDDTNRRILESGGHTLQSLIALSKVIPPEALDRFLLQTPEALDAFDSVIMNAMRADGIIGDGDPNSDLDEIDNLIDMKKVDPTLPRALIEGSIQDVVDPESHPVLASKSIEYLFGRKGGLDITKFPEDEWEAVYATVASPQVTQRVKQLTQESNPEMWETYTTWVYDKFFKVNQGAASDLNIPAALKDYIKPEFDFETGQFRVTSPITNDPNMPPEMLRQYQDMYSQRYRKYNMALRSIMGVIEADGLDPALVLGPMLQQYGIETPTAAPNETGGPDERTPKQDVLKLSEGPKDPRGKVIKSAAEELEVDPVDLATVIGYETIGTLDPSMWGGENGDYLGLIQFGKEEREQFGAEPGQSFDDQMKSVVKYFKARGLPPGADLLEIYTTVLTGSPGNYDTPDSGGTPRSHVARMKNSRYRTMAEEIMAGG